MTTVLLRGNEYQINPNIVFEYHFLPYVRYVSLINKTFSELDNDGDADQLLSKEIQSVPVNLTNYIARLIKTMIPSIPTNLVDEGVAEGIYLKPTEYVAIYEAIASIFKDDPDYKDVEFDLDEPIEIVTDDENLEEKKAKLKAELASLEK